MANKRISELTTITGANLADADLLVVVDVSDTTMASSGTNKKITMAELAKDSALTDNLIAKTTLTTDGDVLTRAAGAPARITRADLAADSAFSSRYVAKSGDAIWLDANASTSTLGSPSFSSFTAWTVYAGVKFDAASTEVIGWNVVIPSWWTTFNIKWYWTNDGAGSGDVVWKAEYNQPADGGNMSTGSLSTATVAAPAQYILKVTTLASNISRAGDVLQLISYREGGNGADTLGNDAVGIGVLLERAS